MSGGRERVRMSAEEVQALLAENRKVQVASVGKDGTPHLTTLFYVVHEGMVAFWTYATSQKVRNLERDDRVVALVEAGEQYHELRGVSITGRASVVRDPEEVRAIGAAVAVAMSGVSSFEELGELGRDLVEQQAAKRVGVLVHPERVASWDHRKMA